MTECFVIVSWVLWRHDRERSVNQIDSLSVQGFCEEPQHNREGVDSNRYFRSTAGVVSDIENIAADELSR